MSERSERTIGHSSALERFSPATRAWFAGAFEASTAAQESAWSAAAAGEPNASVSQAIRCFPAGTAPR